MIKFVAGVIIGIMIGLNLRKEQVTSVITF